MNKQIIEMFKQSEEVSQILKSLSHPVRLKLLCALTEGEMSVSELTEMCDISQSAMSQFLNRMRTEGLLESRREAHFVFYKIADTKLIKLVKSLKEIYCK